MRKIAALLSVLMLVCAFAYGQTRTITGQVTNEKGEPIPFATVTETGTQNAVTADATGNYRITIQQNSTLTITATGHDPRVVTPSGSTANVTLAVRAGEMTEVVVTTAFGIKREQRTTPYSSQVLEEEQLKIIPQTSVNNMLAGKVVGAQFRGQSPMKLNSSGYLRLRGGLGLGDVAPIFVVDGTIVNSFDLNPDDVEDITVLKGVNATVLFGAQAAGGAIVITTRKRGATAGTSIEVNQGVTFDKVYIVPDYQNMYAGGSTYDLIQFNWAPGMPDEWQALDGKYFHDYTDDASWGPRMVGQEYIPWYAWTPGHKYSGMTARLTPQPDNARDFYNTGVTNVTNVSFAKNGQGFNTRVAYTLNLINGMIPNSSQEKHTIFATLSGKLSDRFEVNANINFINNKIKGEFVDGYANQSSGSFNQWFHRDLDMDIMRELRGVRTPIGTYPSWNLSLNPTSGNAERVWKGNYWYNFYTYFDLLDLETNRDRIFGDVGLTYNITRALKLRGTVRKNQLTTNYENIVPNEMQNSATQTGILASYSTGITRSDIMNYELLAMYNERFFDQLDLSLNAGGNWYRSRFNSATAATVNGLNVPGLYAISNSASQPAIGNSRDREEVRSMFAFGNLEWNRTVALDFALRNDWYSTNPVGDDLLSHSLGLSFTFADMVRDALPWLNFGKAFISWGKKPLPLGLYDLNFLYGVNANLWEGNYLMGTPNAAVGEGVTGSLITTYEGGVEFKVLNNRLGLNVTYYNEVNEGAPLSVAVDNTSGFTSILINALKVVRKGIEVQLTGRPIVRNNFNWDIVKNFGWLMDNTVSDFPAGQDQLLLAGGSFGTRFARAFHEPGKDWGQLIGGGIMVNEDGIPLIDADGEFVRDPNKHYGSVVPHINGGLINTFTYKNLIFNFSIDYQIGGNFFSLSEQWGHFSGLLAATAATNDRGFNVRDAVEDGGGVHVVGVSAADEHTPVDMYVDAQTYFHQFYTNQIAEPFVHSLTFVKLREVSIGYQLPIQRWNLGRVFKGASVSVVSRNPLLIYRETDSFDPSEISGLQGEDGQFPGTRSIGFNVKFNF